MMNKRAAVQNLICRAVPCFTGTTLDIWRIWLVQRALNRAVGKLGLIVAILSLLLIGLTLNEVASESEIGLAYLTAGIALVAYSRWLHGLLVPRIARQ